MADFSRVIYLAVEHDDIAAVVGQHGLMSRRRHVDVGQAPVSQDDLLLAPHGRIVGPPGRHAHECSVEPITARRLPIEFYDAGYTTHVIGNRSSTNASTMRGLISTHHTAQLRTQSGSQIQASAILANAHLI